MGSVVTEYSERNAYRVSPYHRLDLAVDWTIKKTKKFETGLNFSVYNVYNRQNPFLVYRDGSKLMQLSIFPLMPSVSYTFYF